MLVCQACPQRVVPGCVDVDSIPLIEVVDPVPCLEHLDVHPRLVQSVRHAQTTQTRPNHYGSPFPSALCSPCATHSPPRPAPTTTARISLLVGYQKPLGVIRLVCKMIGG